MFNPLAAHASPTSHVGIVGIGGLGHMGVKFAAGYGCDVTAFTSSESKFDEARGFGAHHIVLSRDTTAIKNLAGKFDLLIVTVNVPLDWDALIRSVRANRAITCCGSSFGTHCGPSIPADCWAEKCVRLPNRLASWHRDDA